ncbi:UDP-N-acetylglucosamine 1-carboxyvinyltransferase (plasmid) [Pontibacillus sp. ALD_SL1]|uniref:UDP-N-acetylglucosamine 1-carboxyvinyltransferase n=1 Tax=Pontibacillus sp. ALD_SL1 TaxID=2777185 RepID=UPI001A96397C|nr:UDP-N-acetylglucosamine 1-carboxyvinyltransferase [Pontibacillus sp. ALD_SL1]QST02907.1 UDP-N-acetylglucosamine 1-carboxyvinyltransferase [Pontibacillus sp. ALD_SL1]
MRSEQVIINGGVPLKGKISIQGSKNASLPILASTALFEGEVVLHNVPDLVDIRAMLSILEYLGARYTFEKGCVRLDCKGIQNKEVPEEYTNRLRASSLLLGPLLGRYKECQVGMPGGCKIGVRPLDIHFSGFKKLGALVDGVESGLVHIRAQDLKGEFTLDMPSVGATENLIMAAVFGTERVVLRNYAKEPEVMDLIHFLQSGGAKISFEEDHGDLVIEGVKTLHGTTYQVQPDRIEAGTYCCAALATKGDVTLAGVNPKSLSSLLEKLRTMGGGVDTGDDWIRVYYRGDFIGTTVKTAVYPGFPTDLQPQIGVLMTQAKSASHLTEDVFDHRFRYIDELLRLNGEAKVEGRTAYIEPSHLSGCRVEGYDLRGTASMIMAGLCSSGVTHVSGLRHLYRGYEAFIEKLQHLGADIAYL